MSDWRFGMSGRGKKDTKRLLLCACFLPRDPAKSFHTLIMKYLARRGWAPTIATIGHPVLPFGSTQWEGVEVWNFQFGGGYLARCAAWIHEARCAVNRPQRRPRPPRSGFASFWETGSALVDYPLMALQVLSSFPDGYRPYVGTITRASVDAHRKNPWRAVLSIYGPFTNHVVARDVHRATGLPWVALVKDFYSAPDWHPRAQSISGRIRNAAKRVYERRVLRGSALLVPYTDQMGKYLDVLIGGVPVRVLGNCYDPEQFDAPQPSSGSTFDAVCVGDMPLANQRLLFASLRALRHRQSVTAERFRVTFVGANAEVIRECARAHDCLDLVCCVPPVSHGEAIAYMRGATCLLLYLNAGILPRRLPEYLAARRPILAFPDERLSPICTTLQRYGAAVIAGDVEALRSTLEGWYLEYVGTGRLSATVDEDVVRGFGADQRAAELEAMLLELGAS